MGNEKIPWMQWLWPESMGNEKLQGCVCNQGEMKKKLENAIVMIEIHEKWKTQRMSSQWLILIRKLELRVCKVFSSVTCPFLWIGKQKIYLWRKYLKKNKNKVHIIYTINAQNRQIKGRMNTKKTISLSLPRNQPIYKVYHWHRKC